MIGVVIQVPDARRAVEQVIEAERAGVPAVWAISGRGFDLLPAWAAAAVQTERVLLGTSIIRTWTRHPIGFAQEALALEQLAPGRFRLGIGPSSRAQAEQMYGARFDKPLTHLREYLVAIRTLLHEGRVDLAGEQVTARAELPAPARVPVLASAAGLRAFALCGELADGAITWVAPKSYLVEQALPALRRAAARVGRSAPPVVAHVPIAVTEDRGKARELARAQLAGFAGSPNFTGTWAAAGHDPAAGYTDALLDDLLVSGSSAQVAAGLRAWLAAGMGEVMAQPMIDPDDPTGSIARGFAAVAHAVRR
jgi:F420-dependent oxidoreductase-like protein